MKKKKKQVKKLPTVEYKFVDSPDNQEKIDKAFDTLFDITAEEMLKERSFTDEELENLTGLDKILKLVRSRLILEGKVKIENGKTIFLENKNDTISRI